MSATKRPGCKTPEGRPAKRKATSSPEEGEVDDANGVGVAGPSTTTTTSTAEGSNKFKIPFPFKNKNSLLSRIEGPHRVIGERRDRIHGRVRGRNYDEPELRSYRPVAVYDRSEEDERRFRQEEAPYSRDRQPRSVGTSRRDVQGDHYEPSNSNELHYRPEHNRGWDREYERRDWERERTRSPSRWEGPVPKPAPVCSPARSSSPLSVSRGRSLSRSASPQNQRDGVHDKRRHRLPTPRNTSYPFSPLHDEYDYDRVGYRGGRNRPHARDKDPRGQYHREELEDYDRHYSPPSDFDWEAWRRRPPGPGSPGFRSETPPKSLLTSDRAQSPAASLLRPSSPISSSAQAINGNSALQPDIDHSREAVSFAFRRPGAPLNIHSPPSLRGSAQSTTPAPPPVPSVQSSLSAKPPVIEPVKLKRIPIKRTREEEKTVYHRVFVGCGHRDDYEIMTKLGEGTFGEVHKAVHKHSRDVVALKRILMHNEKEGMPVTALREIKILKALKHPCIIGLVDMFVISSNVKDSPMSVYMVFPYMDHDLAGLLENERVKLSPSQIKLYMKQLLEGTEYMHHNNIVHRDMKAANLLISNDGSLKIADFGLARTFIPFTSAQCARERRYTNCVVTRWYRPPELLLGTRQYGGEIDIWGIGCVLGEMIMRRPILPGNSDLDQLNKIWSICGSPNQQNWPDYDKLPGCDGHIRFKPQERRIKQVYDSLGKETCALMDRLLTLDPRERILASEALDHEYFWSDPLPADPKSLPTYEASHEFDQRGRRHQYVAQAEVKPPIRHGLPPPLHNRNARIENMHNQAFPPGVAQPHVAQNSFSSLNGIPPYLPVPPLQRTLPPQRPPPPMQNSWTSAPARDAGPWGPNQCGMQVYNFEPSFIEGKRGAEQHERRQQPSQLPPRPPGLPARPQGQPMGRRDILPQNPRFGDNTNAFARGGPIGGGLNYG